MTPPPPQRSDPSPPALFDELTHEILLRVPPDKPECLLRASLVCEPWNLLLSDRAFLRRYREFHRAPPLLGFFDNCSGGARFVPTTSFRLPDSDLASCRALDCRHGRTLLYDGCPRYSLLVWDPMTGEKQHVPFPDIPDSCYNAAVFCATPDCDHLSCHGGPFLIAFVATDAQEEGASACLYSSETGVWSEPSDFPLGDSYLDRRPAVQVGDALYFTCDSSEIILRYDLGGDRPLSMIYPPDIYEDGIALMPVEDGALGLAGLDTVNLHLWSLKSSGRVPGWEKDRVIKLKLLPIGHPRDSVYHLIGIAKGRTSDIIFVTTDVGVFMIELKSGRATKVYDRNDTSLNIFPYMSFCTPGRIMLFSKEFAIRELGAGPVVGAHRSSISMPV